MISPIPCLLNQMDIIHHVRAGAFPAACSDVALGEGVSTQPERATGKDGWKCAPHHKYVSSIFSCCGRKTPTNT